MILFTKRRAAACVLFLVALTIGMVPAAAQCTPPHCSVVIPTGTAATGSVTSNNLGGLSMRIEIRLHGQNWSALNSVPFVFGIGGFFAQYLGGSGLPNALFFGGPDTASTGYGNCLITIGSPTDILIGINRDVPNNQLRAYVLDSRTGAQIG